MESYTPGDKIIFKHNIPKLQSVGIDIQGKKGRVVGRSLQGDGTWNHGYYICKLRPMFGMSPREITQEFILKYNQFDREG